MNHFIRLVIVVSLAIFSFIKVEAQGDAIFHLDKPYYVAGEAVFYNAYLPATFDGVSGKVKVVVASGDKSFRVESFVQLSDGQIAGYFKVPFNVSSDVYRFSFYALANGSFGAVEFTNFDLPIYNDLSGCLLYTSPSPRD